MTATCYIIDAPFADKSVMDVKEDDMNRSVVMHLMSGNEIGIWHHRTVEDDADLTVIALYGGAFEQNRENSVIAFFLWVRPGTKDIWPGDVGV